MKKLKEIDRIWFFFIIIHGMESFGIIRRERKRERKGKERQARGVPMILSKNKVAVKV